MARRGRPRKFDESAARAAIKDVFWERGFEGTSLDDLIEASGAPRQSLYNAFGAKDALFECALGEYVGQELELLVSALDAPGDALANMRTILAFFEVNLLRGRGCLVTNELARLKDGEGVEAERRARLQAALRRVQDAAVRAFARAIAAGQLPKEVSAEVRGAAFFSMLQGLQLLSKAGLSADEIRAATSGAHLLLR